MQAWQAAFNTLPVAPAAPHLVSVSKHRNSPYASSKPSATWFARTLNFAYQVSAPQAMQTAPSAAIRAAAWQAAKYIKPSTPAAPSILNFYKAQYNVWHLRRLRAAAAIKHGA